MEPMLYTCNTVLQSPMGETWCTFPNNLLNRLTDEQKEAMFQMIQLVIDQYEKIVDNAEMFAETRSSSISTG